MATSGRDSTPTAGSGQSRRPGFSARLAGLPWWQRALVWIGVAVVIAVVLILIAKALRSIGAVQDFVETYPGTPDPRTGTPEGFPGWLRWQHYLNFLFLLLIVSSGWRIHTVQRPSAYWTPKKRGRTAPKKVSLDTWFHQCIDVLWVTNGVVFIVLLFATGQWLRLVPTTWAVFPNAVSAGLQYASLDWPVDNSWVSYNSLQQITYFLVVFVLAPLAILSGFRLSTLWPANAKGLSKAYKLEWARRLHFPVMIAFVVFVIIHVFLVFTTGALKNLNHMFAGTNAAGWAGFWLFVLGLVVAVGLAAAARPVLLRPIASLMGKVSRN